MSNKRKVGFFLSWPIIILALFCFWPLGIFLIIRRTIVDRKTAMGSGKFLKTLGIIFCVIAGIGLLASISDGFDSTDIIMILIFGGAGAGLIYLSYNNKKRAENIKKYIAIIVNGGERQLDAIAASVSKSYDVVKKDIQKMIDNGFLKNAYIDENTRKIVITTDSRPTNVDNHTDSTAYYATNEAVAQPKLVACPCCGANNTITGTIGECEYCGATLN